MTGSTTHVDDTDGTEDANEHSRWPIVAAIGVAGLYFGTALALVGLASDVIPYVVGLVIAGSGIVVAITGLGGWLDQAYISQYWRQQISERKHESYEATMGLFLTTDAATFGAGFVYYFFIRVGGWPPSDLPNLLSSILLVNTAMLVASSFTLYAAHQSLERGLRKRFLGLLGVTIVLGGAFVAGQVYEYYGFIVEQGFTLTSGIFGSAFFGLTGLHGLHVTLGVILLSIIFVRAVLGQYSGHRDTSIVTVSLYWHFVDVVWLFLVVVLYLGASIGS